MRIAILAIYVRGADAVGLQLIEWVRLLREQGHEVRLYVEQVGHGTPDDVRAITSVVAEGDPWRGDGWSFVEATDLVICDYPAYYPLAESLRLLSRPAVLFSYHGVTPPELWTDPAGKRFLEGSRRRAGLVHFADLAVARSEFSRQELHQLTGYPLDRIRVIPCIVPLPRAHPERRNTGGAGPLILAVGRLAAHKRPYLLVEALGHVRRELPAARLVLVGDARGPSHVPVVAEVRRRAAALGLAKQVHLTGLVDDALLDHLYRQADVLVSASAHEGFNIPVVEAMGRGVPVVAMAAGALPETVGDAGILVPSGDVPGLAGAIVEVVRDADRRERLVEQGYARARGYTYPVVAAQVRQLLEQLPARRRPRRALPRLRQLVDVRSLDSAAALGLPLDLARGRSSILSSLAARARAWMTSDVRQQIDALTRHQVAYNRHVAQTLHALDELSALLSEQQAAQDREAGA